MRSLCSLLLLCTLLGACIQGSSSDDGFTPENLCVEDDFPRRWRVLRSRYALGTSVHFQLTHPYTEAETHLELRGDAFEWDLLEDGSINARAVASGDAEIEVFIGGAVVSTEHIEVEEIASADFLWRPIIDLSFSAYSRCEVEGCVERIAVGARAAFFVTYFGSDGLTLAGRGVAEGDHFVTGLAGDFVVASTENEGVFELPLHVREIEVTRFEYRVASVATFNIEGYEEAGLYRADFRDLDGNALEGSVEWEVDGVLQDATGELLLLETDGPPPEEVRARVGDAEAVYVDVPE
ncbi:MAG: hypothetical protein ACI9KE_003395 [Polyangiales bacterium]|jgi:hypothetical protein